MKISMITKGWTKCRPYTIPANKLSFVTSPSNCTKEIKAIAPSISTGVHCNTTLSHKDSGIILELHSLKQGTMTRPFTATGRSSKLTLNKQMYWLTSEMHFCKQITSIKQSPSSEKQSKLIQNSQQTIINLGMHSIKQKSSTRLLNAGEKPFNYSPTVGRPWGISGKRSKKQTMWVKPWGV